MMEENKMVGIVELDSLRICRGVGNWIDISGTRC